MHGGKMYDLLGEEIKVYVGRRQKFPKSSYQHTYVALLEINDAMMHDTYIWKIYVSLPEPNISRLGSSSTCENKNWCYYHDQLTYDCKAWLTGKYSQRYVVNNIDF